MVEYEKELLADLESSDEEVEEAVGEAVEEDIGEKDVYESTRSFQEKLTKLITTRYNPFQTILLNPDIESIRDFTTASKVYPLIPELKEKLAQYLNDQESDFLELLAEINHAKSDLQSDEYRFILTINELSTLINNEILAFTMHLKSQYKLVFPELEHIVAANTDYVRTFMIIQQDLANIQQYEQELKKLMANDKVLVIIMSALQQSKDQFQLSPQDMDKLNSCAKLILQLDDILHQLSNFISHKLARFAPNVSAIIGPIVTSQLLIASGSLKQLALTPACNIASLGVRDLSSSTKVASKNIRQTGYLYHSDIVKCLPPEIQRSAMRIISGKIILAARIDLSKSDEEGNLGLKLKREIEDKIDKLLAPPEQTPDKALPAPIEIKSKKRGGRRLRKMKERFQMSELRKAQNIMEFGKQEQTIMDEYGEEIGLGVSRTGGLGRLGQIQINKNTSARMSKAMVERLQKQKQQDLKKSILNDDEFDHIILGGGNKDGNKDAKTEVTDSSKSLPPAPTSKWLTGSMKRQLDSSSMDSNNVEAKRINLGDKGNHR
ncbi:PRP31 [Candida oxycetoniae]|uniref:PRP31 n=1 Tax=Candida oxycetoniae TaxID=497107 RepID=A0AAI9T130_9ASCO|nr:PRP31 [Candida oxycetoniae]KAI3406286.2 PRP31 [Candida oxycetoniae]